MRTIAYTCLTILLFSCSGNNADSLYTIQLSRKDFTDKLVLEGVVDPIRSTTLVCPMYVDGKIIYLIEDGTYVEKGDTLCIIEDNSLTEQYDNWKTALETTEATLEKVIADLRMNFALLEAQVQTNDADTKMAVRDSLELLYASPKDRRIKELEIERLALERSKLNRKLETLKVIDQTEIKRWEVELQRLRMNLKSVEDRLSALILTAPANGLAIRATNRMTDEKMLEGDPVWSNMPILHMPETDAVKISITASERDFKYVSVGDSIYFTFDAMPGNFAYGKLSNKVPVGREYARGSKVKIFDMEASVDSILYIPDPGFTANCYVVVRELKDTIVVPQIAVFTEDSMQVVYVKTKKNFEMRQILTGMYSSKEVVVTAGLAGDEIVSMEKPNSSRVRRTVLLPDSLQPAPLLPEGVENPDGHTGEGPGGPQGNSPGGPGETDAVQIEDGEPEESGDD